VNDTVLRKIIRTKKEEGTGGWGKFHSEELRSTLLGWAEHVACTGKARNTYSILDGSKSEEKRSVVRCGRVLDDK
jgi:hypothetical protein